MEEWVNNRTDIKESTKKVYIAYIHMFQKIYGTSDPKNDSVSSVNSALAKMSISSRTKMLNILSKYSGKKEYSKAISPLLRSEYIRQVSNKPLLNISEKELRLMVETICDIPLKVVYLLMLDFPHVSITDYHRIRINLETPLPTDNYINKSWTKIRFNIKCNNFEYKLPVQYQQFKDHFKKHTVLITRKIPALVMAIKKQNKKFGIPRGASIFKLLKINQKAVLDGSNTSSRNNSISETEMSWNPMDLFRLDVETPPPTPRITTPKQITTPKTKQRANSLPIKVPSKTNSIKIKSRANSLPIKIPSKTNTSKTNTSKTNSSKTNSKPRANSLPIKIPSKSKQKTNSIKIKPRANSLPI